MIDEYNYVEAVNLYCEIADRFDDASVVKVVVPRHNCVYMNTSSGPSSKPCQEIFDWLEDRGLRHGSWKPGWWTDNWPQIDDPDPRVKISFSVVDYRVARWFAVVWS